VYVCLCMCVYMFVYVCLCMCVYVCVCVCVCLCVFVCVVTWSTGRWKYDKRRRQCALGDFQMRAELPYRD
jgi:hypothetical protein